MTDDVKHNFKSRSTWTRLLFIILFAITYRVASIVLFAITILQFIKALITGKPFSQLQSFGGSLATYNKEVVEFLSYQSDEKPFPVGPWPEQPAPPKSTEADDVIIVAEPAKSDPKSGQKKAEKKDKEGTNTDNA